MASNTHLSDVTISHACWNRERQCTKEKGWYGASEKPWLVEWFRLSTKPSQLALDNVDGWNEAAKVVTGFFLENLNLLASSSDGLTKVENWVGQDFCANSNLLNILLFEGMPIPKDLSVAPESFRVWSEWSVYSSLYISPQQSIVLLMGNRTAEARKLIYHDYGGNKPGWNVSRVKWSLQYLPKADPPLLRH